MTDAWEVLVALLGWSMVVIALLGMAVYAIEKRDARINQQDEQIRFLIGELDFMQEVDPEIEQHLCSYCLDRIEQAKRNYEW